MKKRWKDTKLVVGIIRYLLVVLFIYAGLTKILEGDLFYHTVLNSPIFGGKALAEVAAWAIPALEITTALLLIGLPTKRLGLYSSLGLLLVVSTYLISILFFSASIPCTCRTIFPVLGWYGHLHLTIACMLLAVIAIYLSQAREGIDKTHFVAQQSRSKPKTCINE